MQNQPLFPQGQGHVSTNSPFLNLRSNSMYNIAKDRISLAQNKQAILPQGIKLTKDHSQLGNYNSIPPVMPNSPDSAGKFMNLGSLTSIPHKLSNNTIYNSPTQSLKNQYSISKIQQSSSQSKATSHLNISNGSNGQCMNQYNQPRVRHQSHFIPFNSQQNSQRVTDLQRLSYSQNMENNPLKMSTKSKENDTYNHLSPVFSQSQQIKQISSPLSSQNQLLKQQSLVLYQTPQLRPSILIQSDKKGETPSSSVLTPNQNYLNQVQSQQQIPHQPLFQNEEMPLPTLLKDSTIQFITNSDLENELRDLDYLLQNDKEAGQNLNTDNFFQTDKESIALEQKLEIDFLIEKNEVLTHRVEELTNFQQEYEKEQQLVLLQKNTDLEKVQEENQHLFMKYQTLERECQVIQEELNSQRQIISDLGEKDFNNQQNNEINEELEKRILYLEEKMRDDEIQYNQLKLVVFKQEENINLLEDMIREAKEAEQVAETLINEDKQIIIQREMEITEKQYMLEDQREEIDSQKKCIDNFKAKIEDFKAKISEYERKEIEFEKFKEAKIYEESQRITKESSSLAQKIKALEQNEKDKSFQYERILNENNEFIEKTKELEYKLIEIEEQLNIKQKEALYKQQDIDIKQQEIIIKQQEVNSKQEEIIQLKTENNNISHNNVLLQQKTKELTEQVSKLQLIISENDKQLIVYQQKLQEQIDQSQGTLNQKLNDQSSNHQITVNQLNEKIVGLQDQLKRLNQILDSSSINFELSIKEIAREKNEALEKISKLLEEINVYKKQIEEYENKYDDQRMKVREITSQKENTNIQLERMRNDNSELRRIFQETQQNLNNRNEQLMTENNKLKQIQLQVEKDTDDKLNQIINIIQQEKLQLIQDNKKIVEEKLELSDKIRQLQQTNIELLSNAHQSENSKNIQIDQLQQKNTHYENNIDELKLQINQFIEEIKSFQDHLDNIQQDSHLKTEQISNQESIIEEQKLQIEELIEKSYLEQENGRSEYDMKIKEFVEEKQIHSQKYNILSQNLILLEEKLHSIIQQLNDKTELCAKLEFSIQVQISEKEQILVENSNCYKEISRLNTETREVEKKLFALQENLNESLKHQQNQKDEMLKLKEQHSHSLSQKDKIIYEQKEKLKNSSYELNEKSLVLEDMSIEVQKQKDFQQIIQRLKKEKEIIEIEQIKLVKDNEKYPDNCEIEQILKEHNDILTQYHQETLRLKEKLQQKQQMIDKFNSKLQNQQQKITEYQQEIEYLNKFITTGKRQFEKSIEDYQQKIERFQKQFKQEQSNLNNQIQLLTQDKQLLQQHLNQIQKEQQEEIQKLNQTNNLASSQ